LYVKDVTAPNTATGSLLWDSTLDYWKAGVKDSESKVLLSIGDSVFSSSIQTALSGTFGYNDFSSSVATSFSASAASVATVTGTFSSSVATSFSASAASVTALSSSVATDFSASNAARVALSASIASTDSTQTTNITANSASAAGAYASASAYSSSAATALNTLSGSVATSFSASAASQNALSGAIATSISASVAAGTPTFANITGKPAGLVSGSSQVVLNDADKTGFNTDDVAEGSSNLYHTVTRVQNIVTAYNYFDASSDVDITQTTGYSTFSGSIATSVSASNYRITVLETTIDGGSF
jgi:hypothetical protein